MTYMFIFATIYSLIIVLYLINNCRKIIKFRVEHKHWHIDDIDGTNLDDRVVLAFYAFVAGMIGFLAVFFYIEI